MIFVGAVDFEIDGLWYGAFVKADATFEFEKITFEIEELDCNDLIDDVDYLQKYNTDKEFHDKVDVLVEEKLRRNDNWE